MATNPIREGAIYALEKNLLKFRALEMVLVLFYIEDLKTFIRQSIDATDLAMGRAPRIPASTKKPMQKAFSILVEDGVLSQAESDEIELLIEYRNGIGHKIQELTADVGTSAIAKRARSEKSVKYDYRARKRLKHFCQDLPKRMQPNYVLSVSDNRAKFASAEFTYEQELNRLWKQIQKQYMTRFRLMNDYTRGMAAEAQGQVRQLEQAVKRLVKMAEEK